jgi:hypothetical protein
MPIGSVSDPIGSDIGFYHLGELLFKIFDYLDGCITNMAFSNLNHRFQQLLNSSSLLFKIILDHSTSDEMLMNNYKRKIFSINSLIPLRIDEFSSSFTFDSSCIALESVVLNEPEQDVLIFVLSELSYLPRLFSLTVNVIDVLDDLTDIFRIILSLSVLKYYQLKTCPLDESILLPMATSKQLSLIEHLIINYSYTFDELSVILSHTSQLRRSSLLYINEIDPNLGTILYQ